MMAKADKILPLKILAKNKNLNPNGLGFFRKFMKKKSFRIPIARMIIVYKIPVVLVNFKIQ